jgi:serine/threonine-protein kinase
MIPSGTLVVTYTSTDGSPKTTNIPVNFTREAE